MVFPHFFLGPKLWRSGGGSIVLAYQFSKCKFQNILPQNPFNVENKSCLPKSFHGEILKPYNVDTMKRKREKFNLKLYYQKWWLMIVTTVLSSTAGEPRENIISSRIKTSQTIARGKELNWKSFFILSSSAFFALRTKEALERFFLLLEQICCPRSFVFWWLVWKFCVFVWWGRNLLENKRGFPLEFEWSFV